MITSEPAALLREIAHGIIEGKIFHDGMLECREEAGFVFCPLLWMHESQLARLMADNPGMIYEYVSKATGCEAGLPVFASCHYLSQADAATVRGLVDALQGAEHTDSIKRLS